LGNDKKTRLFSIGQQFLVQAPKLHEQVSDILCSRKHHVFAPSLCMFGDVNKAWSSLHETLSSLVKCFWFYIAISCLHVKASTSLMTFYFSLIPHITYLEIIILQLCQAVISRSITKLI
jgi:hypothetical protein